MTKLVRLYIRNILFGFGLSALFVCAILYFNIANLWHLVSTSNMGWVAVAMLFMFHGLVFAAVQFSIAIMRMEKKDTPTGGKRDPLIIDMQAEMQAVAIPVKVSEEK